MPRLYQYVGPDDIPKKVAQYPPGKRIICPNDLKDWLGTSVPRDELVPATFVVDHQGFLRLADRHSEHVACAGGKPVYCAGELFVGNGPQGLEIMEISNQSTGYCPDIVSWEKLQQVLETTGIPHPEYFTLEVIFRRCPACGQRNIVKDDWFYCAVCEKPLPEKWNFADG